MLSPKDPCRYPLALLQEFQSVDFIHHTANSNPFHQMSTINLFTPTRPLTYQVSLFSQLPFPQPLWVSVPYSTSRVESWPIVLLCPVDGFLCTIAEVSTLKKSKCCMSKESGVQVLRIFLVIRAHLAYGWTISGLLPRGFTADNSSKILWRWVLSRPLVFCQSSTLVPLIQKSSFL